MTISLNNLRPFASKDIEIQRLRQEVKELHATIAKIHEEYRPEVKDAERWRKHGPILIGISDMTLQEALDWQQTQNQRIAELTEENERLKAENKQLTEWLERGNAHVGMLVVESERLRSFIKRQKILGRQPGSWTTITDEQIDNAVYDIARENK